MDVQDLRNMKYWYTETVRYGIHLADVLVICDGSSREETPFIFKKYPALVYVEEIRDQVIKYTPDYKFLQVLNMLMSHFPTLRVTTRRMQA